MDNTTTFTVRQAVTTVTQPEAPTPPPAQPESVPAPQAKKDEEVKTT